MFSKLFHILTLRSTGGKRALQFHSTSEAYAVEVGLDFVATERNQSASETYIRCDRSSLRTVGRFVGIVFGLLCPTLHSMVSLNLFGC